ncbi:MAG: GAF domain-containing protein [Candidatus Izemoplasmatales bacterium]
MYTHPNKEISKEERYELFISYVKGYLDKFLLDISNLANFSAIVYDFFEDVNWAGFYLFHEGKLVLGPFQGKPACVEIEIGKGVCGTAAKERKTVLVDDTHAFPGHIACDPLSKSEIVIPIIKNGMLYGVLDLDSPSLSRFSKQDQLYLEKAVHLLVDIL